MRLPLLYSINVRLKPARRRLRAWWLTRRGGREDAVVLLSRIVNGMFRQDEIRLLYRAVCSAQGPGDIAEIGSWKGRTAVVMGLALQDSGHTDCRIYAIDHHEGSDEHQERIARHGSTLPIFRDNIRALGVSDVVEEIVADSVRGVRLLEERGIRLRMAFIDGAHDEDSVRQDIRLFLPLLSPGALVALHDCEPGGGFPGVWKAYQSELASRVTEVGRASSLLVARLNG